MDVLRGVTDPRALRRELVHEEERNGHEQADEDRKGNQPVFLSDCEELLSEGTHGDRVAVVLLDDPSTPLNVTEAEKRGMSDVTVNWKAR